MTGEGRARVPLGGADSAGSAPFARSALVENSTRLVTAMVQKIGVFILVTFAIIALVREPDAVAAFINAIGSALQTILATLAQLFQSVQ